MKKHCSISFSKGAIVKTMLSLVFATSLIPRALVPFALRIGDPRVNKSAGADLDL